MNIMCKSIAVGHRPASFSSSQDNTKKRQDIHRYRACSYLYQEPDGVGGDQNKVMQTELTKVNKRFKR